MYRDSRQSSHRYERSLTPRVDTFRLYIPSSRPSRPAQSSRYAPSSYHHPAMRQLNSSPSLPKPTIRRYPRTPATGRALRPVPTGPCLISFPVSLSRQLVRGRSSEKKESTHPPASFSGIWALHTAPHSSRVHHCTVYFQRPTKSDPQPFNEAKLRVCLSRHAGDDIPLDIHSLRDHGDLTTLSESCKVLDSMVIEVNAGQKGGKIFLPFELTSNWQAMMNETTLDISQWTVEGTNTVRCIQLTDETADIFILRASSMPSGNQSNTDVRLSQSNPYDNLQLSYPSVLGTDVITSLATAKFPPVDPQMHLPENDEDFLRRCEELGTWTVLEIQIQSLLLFNHREKLYLYALTFGVRPYNPLPQSLLIDISTILVTSLTIEESNKGGLYQDWQPPAKTRVKTPWRNKRSIVHFNFTALHELQMQNQHEAMR
ncbi:hypothetical protein EDD18DRAFT_1118958 [Armillaria luteobubalina]|uniref:Uncharacterized protein n=1 Tax=Armillaria luteobubalina TaxID=153913 RepID=A0AA39TWB4_9AGAR|nr:hypothetical protein EDD18DRAFT_1118958 [Armillaria luteobubalina]